MEAIKQFHIKVNEKWALLSIQQLLRAKKKWTIMDKDKTGWNFAVDIVVKAKL